MRSHVIVLGLVAGCAAAPCGAPSALDTDGAWVAGKVKAPGSWLGGGSSPAPVEAADVALADAGDKPVEGLFHQRSDTDGGFTIEGVPKGYAFVAQAHFTQADGTQATLETLVAPNDRSTASDITLGSTLATQLATEGLSGPIGAVDTAQFADVAKQFDQLLADAATPPANNAEALDEAKRWLDANPDLAAQVAALHQQATAGGNAATRTQTIRQAGQTDPLSALAPVY